MQHFGDYSWGHYIQSSKAWDDSKISEFLKNDIDYAQIETFIVKWNEIQPEHSGIYIGRAACPKRYRYCKELSERGRAEDTE